MARQTRKNAALNRANGSTSAASSSSISTAASAQRQSTSTLKTTPPRTTRRRLTRSATKHDDDDDQGQDDSNDMSVDSDFDMTPSAPKDNTETLVVDSRKRSAKHSPPPSTSAKKPKQQPGPTQDDAARPLSQDNEMSYPSASGSGSDEGSEFHAESGTDDEDGDEWEEVAVAAPTLEQQTTESIDDEDEEEELSGPWQYNAVEIVFDKPLRDIKKSSKNRGVTKEERMIRVLIHQTHLLCLIANGRLRNSWISHQKLAGVALSLVPKHIANSVRKEHENMAREVNALQVLALWWRDSFVVTGPGIQHREYLDIDVVGVEAAIPVSNEECLKRRKNLQRRLLNRSGSTDVCSQLFTGICRALGLKARLVESLQPCPFKVTLPKEEVPFPAEDGESSVRRAESKKGKKKKEVILDDSDTTRGSRVVLPTPHRMLKKSTKLPPTHKSADPPVFWTEVYSTSFKKWITIDPVRGFVNSPLKMHPSTTCTNNVLAYVVAYDDDNYLTDVTRRYTSQWGGITRKLRVQPDIKEGFDWWKYTMLGLMNPNMTAEEDLEEMELLKAEVSERMPTKLGDFNNHPLYALERHIKKFEVLHPRVPVLGHVRGEAVYPRSCVKQARSKENWLRRGRVIKDGITAPVKWVKSPASTIYQMRLRQQTALSGTGSVGTTGKGRSRSRQSSAMDEDDEDDENEDNRESTPVDASMVGGTDQIALFGEWQTEAYQPPIVLDGKVPRNQYGRQDVFTPAMVPIGGTHVKGRNIAQVARLLGVDYAEAVTGFEFQSRRSVPVIQGIIVPSESAELVMDAYQEVVHQRDQESYKKKRAEVLNRWRKMIKGMMMRARLMEEYGGDEQYDGDAILTEGEGEGEGEDETKTQASGGVGGTDTARPADPAEHDDSGAGFMID
ncbi:hypothetical protein BGZ99_005011 [Dissophora globulifera]|uniref:Rad4-domain-containing protein n=1 Tax=Dissophora globulifera TaxID=979702 RepID=A0A9P6UUD3_9FUNG|nr:hypothetical protein BGZ99_005011 [Dissophora globulifera]